jgi:hypothetical protein
MALHHHTDFLYYVSGNNKSVLNWTQVDSLKNPIAQKYPPLAKLIYYGTWWFYRMFS